MNSYSSIRIWLYSSAAIPMPYRVIQIFYLLVLFVAIPCLAPHANAAVGGAVEQRLGVAEASDEGLRAIKKFEVAPGLKIELFAAEPFLANPVSFTTDERGRWYVAETFRVYTGCRMFPNIWIGLRRILRARRLRIGLHC